MLTWAKTSSVSIDNDFFRCQAFSSDKIKNCNHSIVLEKTDLHDRSNPNKINKLANYFRMTL
jgi:hypothetical protein